jgi:hypothetical protein
METKKIDLIETSSTKEAEGVRNFLRSLKPIGVKFREAKEDGSSSRVTFTAWVSLPDPKPVGQRAPTEIEEVRVPASNGAEATPATA